MATFLLYTLLLLPSIISASPLIKRDYPSPGPCSGNCSGHVHDPSVVLRDDGTYFRFTTNDLINIATASSIDGPWTHQGSVISGKSIIDLPGNDDLWAPDCFLFDGTYYLYYAVSASGSQNSDIGVATSTTMEVGSWTDHGSIGVPNNSDYNKIDPNLFQHDPSSPFLLSFGSFWDDIYQIPMANPPLQVDGDVLHLEQNTTARPDNLPLGPSEGSYQFWWNVGGTDYYYLFFSSGSCCNVPPDLAPQGEEYKVMVCRSTQPSGGFTDKDGNDCLDNGGTLVLGSHDDVYAPGGQGVFYDHNLGSAVMYYHYVKPSIGYDYDSFFFGYNKLDFSSGWPVVVS